MYAEQGDLESVKKAIERGTDLNKADESGRTPLMVAALFNHHEIVAELLKNKKSRLTRVTAPVEPL